MKSIFTKLFFILLTVPCFSLNISDYRFHAMPETSYYGGIHGIVKDSIGRIWFSGYDALFVYNGSSFEQMNESITKIDTRSYWTYGQVLTDASKRLYVATNQGLLRFNYQTKDFERILVGNIGPVAQDEDGTIWLIRNNKVESFDPERLSELIQYPFPSDIVPSVYTLTVLCTQNKVYIASEGRVYRLDKESKKYNLFSKLGDESFVIKDILEHNGAIYILTHMNGLYKCDNEGKQIKHYNLSREYGKSSNSKKLYLDSSNIIWAATQSGLILLNPETEEMSSLRFNLNYTYSLPNNSVWSIYPDPDGGTWIGTYGGKLAYMTFFDNNVSYFKASPGGLNHPIVSCFEEDKNGNIWIGTEGGGLNHWNKGTDKISYYTEENGKGIASNMIKKLRYDKKTGDLYISAFNGGLARFDARQDRFIDLKIYHPRTSLRLSIYDFILDDNNGIWMTDPDAELMYYDRKKEVVEVVPLYDSKGGILRVQIETLFLGNDNKLWIVTHGGLYAINIATREVVKHYYIENAPYATNNLCSFYSASNSDIWFGTRGGGINKLDKDGNYINLGEKEGLRGKTVFGILEDTDSRNIWFSTNDGLYFYDNKTELTNKYQGDTPSLCGAFYVRSCFKTSKEEMLFGGTDGFIAFNPSKMKHNNQKSKVFFTDLLINNKKIGFEGDSTLLKQDISTLAYSEADNNKITLSHKQANIELRVSSNSYLESEKNQYAYRMLGLSDKWYFLPLGQKTIQFFNLLAGEYFFEVKAANNDGLWGDDISVLHFEIRPSPFLSMWAYMIYSILLLFIVYFIWRYFTNKKIFTNRLEMEQMKEQNMRELTQARINFFTNISHDLKTPLTLVVDPLKQLKEVLPEDNQSSKVNIYVHLIEKNVNRIQRMISQLLQFREIESQKMTFNSQPGDLIQYINDIFSLFELYANKKGIEADIKSDMEKFHTKFDYDAIEKIFTNLFSNAIKYTSENGFIGVKITETTQEELDKLELLATTSTTYLSIAITNTGAEIPDSKRTEIFESFYRLTSGKPAFEESTGLGLAIVKELVSSLAGKITLASSESKVTFIVVLPFTLNTEEIVTDLISYEYTISEIDNILAESEELNLLDKRNRKAHNVVVIEDDNALRSYMEQHLSEYYNVYTATNGNEGIAKVERIFPQVVVTDLVMPEADGFDVCRSLRSNIKTSHIPIVVLSALGKNTENKIKALESGANVFIDKPFNMDYLLKQVDNLIKNQKELRDLYSKKFVAEPSKITISSMDEELLKRAMEQIELNISNSDYNVETFVSDMGIGRTLLYQKINDIVGMSIKEFIMDVRLKRSAQLLKESDLTISEIADKTGFNNPKYFSICFKKHFELTPTEFKKKL